MNPRALAEEGRDALQAVADAARSGPMQRYMKTEAWVDDDDVWVRRAAILAQLKHGADTDAAQLFAFCLRRAPDRSVWIRKAIGWALRQHARTDPDAVRAFLAAHGDALSGLSRREASKHL